MGPGLAEEDRQWRDDSGALCRWRGAGIPEQGGGREVPERTASADEEVQSGTPPGENATFGIWTLCGPKPEGAGRREAGNLQLFGFHAYLREDPARTVHGATADDPKADAGEAQGD